MGDSESYLSFGKCPKIHLFVIKSLEFQEPFYMHCLQCEVLGRRRHVLLSYQFADSD